MGEPRSGGGSQTSPIPPLPREGPTRYLPILRKPLFVQGGIGPGAGEEIAGECGIYPQSKNEYVLFWDWISKRQLVIIRK